MTRPLRVCTLNMHARHGGAERCANDLLDALAARGHDVRTLVGHVDDPGRDLDDRTAQLPRHVPERIAQKIAHSAFGLTDVVLSSPLRAVRRHPWLAEADIVHGHNLGGGWFNLRALPRIAAARPLVLTLHDMWLLTGDCEHAGACRRFETTCGACPVCRLPRKKRGAVGGMDLTALNLRLKRRMSNDLPHHRVTIVTPSRWLADRVAVSHLRHLACRVIPNGVDLDRFAPRERDEALAALGLPADDRYVAAVAGNWDDPRKGGALLEAIAAQLGAGHRCLVAGAMGPARRAALERAGAVVCPGRQDDCALAAIYSASDAALVLSQQENLPYSVSESLACGCPPVALSVGGIPEMITDGETGWLLPPTASADHVAARALEALDEEPTARSARRRTVRDHAERTFGLPGMVDAYLALYAQLLDATEAPPVSRVLINDWVLTRPRTGVGQYLAAVLAHWPRGAIEPVGAWATRGRDPGAAGDGLFRYPALDDVPALSLRPLPEVLEPGRGSGRRGLGLIKPVFNVAYGQWLRHAWRQAQPGAILEPNHLPQTTLRPCVTTMHDLSVLELPDCHPPDRVAQWKRGLDRALRHTDRFVSVSQATADALERVLGIDPARVTVAPLASRWPAPPPAWSPDRVREQLGLPERSLVCLATLEPRKNAIRLLDALAAMPADQRRNVRLVLAGGAGWGGAAFREALASHPAAGEVMATGYLTDAQAAAIVIGATALVYPSLYEGFGLPPLEAMAVGTPVATSTAPSLREVCGDAALLLDPGDTEGWAQTMIRLVEDAPLREDLVVRGRRRASEFDWETTARRHVEAVRAVME